MPDVSTMQDHIDDLMAEVTRLREQVRDLEAQLRAAQTERDHWQVQALLS